MAKLTWFIAWYLYTGLLIPIARNEFSLDWPMIVFVLLWPLAAFVELQDRYRRWKMYRHLYRGSE